jgi:hypothetical protein
MSLLEQSQIRFHSPRPRILVIEVRVEAVEDAPLLLSIIGSMAGFEKPGWSLLKSRAYRMRSSEHVKMPIRHFHSLRAPRSRMSRNTSRACIYLKDESWLYATENGAPISGQLGIVCCACSAGSCLLTSSRHPLALQFDESWSSEA